MKYKPGMKAIFKPILNGKEQTNNPQYGKEVYIIQVKPKERTYGIRCVDEAPTYFKGGEVLQWASKRELDVIPE